MTNIKRGSLVVISDCHKELTNAIDDYQECWLTGWEVIMSSMIADIETKDGYSKATKKSSNKTYKLKKYGLKTHPFKENRLTAIVIEVIREEHRDLDFIVIKETDGGQVRYCRRAIIERFVK